MKIRLNLEDLRRYDKGLFDVKVKEVLRDIQRFWGTLYSVHVIVILFTHGAANRATSDPEVESRPALPK